MCNSYNLSDFLVDLKKDLHNPLQHQKHYMTEKTDAYSNSLVHLLQFVGGLRLCLLT